MMPSLQYLLGLFTLPVLVGGWKLIPAVKETWGDALMGWAGGLRGLRLAQYVARSLWTAVNRTLVKKP